MRCWKIFTENFNDFPKVTKKLQSNNQKMQKIEKFEEFVALEKMDYFHNLRKLGSHQYFLMPF